MLTCSDTAGDRGTWGVVEMALELTALPAVIVFFSGMLHASITDLKHRKIANWTILALLIAYLPIAMMADLTWVTIATSAAASVLVFAAGFGAFCAGVLGGGDVKLAAICTLWLGAGLVLPFLFMAAILGGAIAIVFLLAARVGRARGSAVKADLSLIPYGPGLACAAVLLFGKSPWLAAPVTG